MFCQDFLVNGIRAIRLDIDLTGLQIFVDRLVDRVMSNRIDNAIEYKKTVTRIGFSCQDDGVGIPEEDNASIFHRGVRGDGKFGLFFIREFLDLSGMAITETSEL